MIFFDYVGGTRKNIDPNTSKAIGVKVWSSSNDSINVIKHSDNINIEIPMQNIVEISYSTDLVSSEKSQTGKSLLGIILMGIGGITPIGTLGAIIGVDALKNTGKKIKPKTTFMISYIEKFWPEDLQILLFQHDKMYFKDAIEEFDQIIADVEKVPKVDWVVAFQNKLKNEILKKESANECPSCGGMVIKGKRFCSDCGAKVEA